MALKLGIQTYQILANDDEVCILSLSSIFLAVNTILRDFACHLIAKFNLRSKLHNSTTGTTKHVQNYSPEIFKLVV